MEKEGYRSAESSSSKALRISELAQLLSAMKDAAEKMENAHEEDDAELLVNAKREILRLQKRIDTLL